MGQRKPVRQDVGRSLMTDKLPEMNQTEVLHERN